ncbi:MAG TPA: Ig-like domain-containing protein [Neobacillus sp.]|jgi:hypothetical protein
MRGKKLFLSKAKVLLFILVLSSFFIGQIASAEGDGTGGGTSGGKSEPLALVSSSIKDGATGVSLKPEITLTFSKNIVNMTVNENNKKCFSLQTTNGTTIPINLTLPDDQIEVDRKDDAIITPKANLAQGTTYSIVISSSLRSKSGVTTGKEIKITFTTEVEKPATKPETAAPKGETTTQPGTTASKNTNTNTNTTDNKNNPNTTSKVDEKPSTDQNTTDSQTKTADNNTTVEQQSNVDKNEDESAVSEETTGKATPYEAITAPKTKTVETQSGNSNAFIYVSVISVIVIIAAIIIYFYIRKKRAK